MALLEVVELSVLVIKNPATRSLLLRMGIRMTSFLSAREKIGLYFTSATQDGLSGSQKLLSLHYPLSYVLFRIFASHIANEAKLAASVFSLSGTLGGHSMNQSSLQVLVRIKHNGSAGKRGWLVILQKT